MNDKKNSINQFMSASSLYAILALVTGVFYREFTKFNGFTGKTMLSIVHTHYFVLGMVFFILLVLLEKAFAFTNDKTKKIVVAYHIGLNLTTIMFLVRGVFQTLATPLSPGASAAISGIAGIGHISLAISLVMILLAIKKAIKNA